MAENREAKALMEQAKKTTEKFFSFGKGKYEQAAEMYTRAGNLFKASKNFEEASEAFLAAADCHRIAGDAFEQTNSTIAAGAVLKKVNPKRAAELLLEGTKALVADGHFSAAAKHQQDAGEMFEAEGDNEAAVDCLKTAAEYYEMENSTSRANSCRLKVAQLSANAGKYDDAVEIYEQVARAAMDNNLLKFSVRNYLFNSFLCVLAKQDTVGAARALDRYKDLDPTFASQRECKLCEAILEACDNVDVDAFTQAVADFDALTPLDAFRTHLLLQAKKMIENAGDSSQLV